MRKFFALIVVVLSVFALSVGPTNANVIDYDAVDHFEFTYIDQTAVPSLDAVDFVKVSKAGLLYSISFETDAKSLVPFVGAECLEERGPPIIINKRLSIHKTANSYHLHRVLYRRARDGVNYFC